MSKLLFFISCWLFWSECRADVHLSSDFYFTISAENYTASLLKQPLQGQEKFVVPSWNIGGEYQSFAENIEMNFAYGLKLEEGQDPLTYQYRLHLEKGFLKIGKIKTDAVIVKNVGGVQATIYLKGECRNLMITTEDSLELTGNVRLGVRDHSLMASLLDLRALNEQNWEMSVESCEGPKGYQQALEEQLREFISNKQKMQDVLLQPFQVQINKKVSDIQARLFAEKQMSLNSSVSVILHPKSVDLDEVTGQLLISGLVKTQLESASEVQKHVDALLTKEEFSKLSQNGFFISQKYISALTESLHDTGFFYKSYLAQSIPGLSSLFRSRLFQFFLWPDLMNFKRNAPFTFEVSSRQLPKIKWSSFHKGSAWYSMDTTLSVLTRTPENTGAHEYGRFSSPFRAQTWMRVYEGQLALGFYKPQMNLQFRWSELYLKLFKPFQYISVNFFGNKISSSLNDFRWKTKLPEIEMEGKTLLRPKSLSGNENWMVLEYSP